MSQLIVSILLTPFLLISCAQHSSIRPETKDKVSHGSREWVSNQYALNDAIAVNDIQLMTKLIDDGASVHFKEMLSAPLWTAVSYNRLEALKVLLDKGAYINELDSQGKTPIFFAKSKEVVDLLVSAGAKVNIKSWYGSYPLHYHLTRYPVSIEAIKALIGHGASLTSKDKNGRTVYMRFKHLAAEAQEKVERISVIPVSKCKQHQIEQIKLSENFLNLQAPVLEKLLT